MTFFNFVAWFTIGLVMNVFLFQLLGNPVIPAFVDGLIMGVLAVKGEWCERRYNLKWEN